MYTDASQHPSSTMEINETSSQAAANSGGFVDSHWNLRKRQVLHSQACRNWIRASQKTGHKPADEADLMTNAQAMQDPALAGKGSTDLSTNRG